VARAEQLRVDPAADGRVGVLRLSTQLVPVFSLASALGLADPAATHGDQHIAVTGEGEQLVGWLVDMLTREPAAGVKIAPVPKSVGGQAGRWFEAVVTCSSGDVVLLIDPRHLGPFSATPLDRDEDPAFAAPVAIAHAEPKEPVALVFSTPVLPEWPVDKFALSARQVAAIVPPTQLIALPGSAAHVAGLTLWRDAAVPIVDYRRDRREHSRHWRRLIARCTSVPHALVAFAIDDGVVMHRTGGDDRSTPDVACPPFASGVFNVNGDRVALLDLDALVAGAA
jgi:chemotaxis signal transduction protein